MTLEMEPQGRNAFARALAFGLGRAPLQVRLHGLAPVADLVLHACLSNLCYDPQCESSREAWLFGMFRDCPERPRFEQAILARLTDLEAQEPDRDLEQLLSLARLLALDGSAAAAVALRRHALAVAEFGGPMDSTGAFDHVAVAGVEGFIDLCRLYGARLMKDPGDSPPWLDLADFPDGCVSMLRQRAESETALSTLLDEWERGPLRQKESPGAPAHREPREDRLRRELSLDKVLTMARAHQHQFPGRYMQFGRHVATAGDLAEVLAASKRESDPEVRMRLLWVFRRAEMPCLDAEVLQAAGSAHEGLRAAAIAALSQLSAPEVAALAQAKLAGASLLGADAGALALFTRNLAPGDAQRIESALASLHPNDEDAHQLVGDLLELTAEHPDEPWLGTLQWIYERSPCSVCRRHAIEQLMERSELAPGLRDECAEDADEDIRELVAAPSLSQVDRPQLAV